jgi:hydrogenase-4 component B
MPITAFMFLIAAISISALPPTNGFLSEWMIFQSMLSSSGINNLVLKLSFPFAIFALALTGGLAIACFVKAFGITFLGLARSENAKHAKEVNKLMLTGQILMAGVVISLMLFMPFFIKIINYSLPITDIYHKLFQNIWVMHSLNSNGAVAPLLILAGLIIVVFAIYAFYKYLNPKIRIYHTWACGYNTNAKSQYSATGFAGPIRRFFEWLYRPEVHTHTQTISGHKTKFTSSLYEVHIKPLFEKSLYDNVVKGLNFLSYFVYKLSHFERHRYSSLIFMLLIFALFSFRVFYKEISWGNIVLEVIVMSIFYKFLFGENK